MLFCDNSEDFKTQVVREVIEKECIISSVASSYDLVSQTVGNWVARYRKKGRKVQEKSTPPTGTSRESMIRPR